MTDHYFDPVNGSDSANGLTPATAKQSYDTYIQSFGSSGDRFFLKRGVDHIISTANTGVRSGVSDSQRTLLAAYGVAQVPYAFVKNPSAVGNMILNGSGRSYVDFEDLYFDGQGVCQYSIYLFASGSTANVGHRISRCYFTNMLSGQAGLIFGATATSTGDAGYYLIEDSYFFDNPGHGLIPNGAHDILVRRCKFLRNGFDAQFGGHGFSAKYRVTDALSGWTSPGVNKIWQRTLAAYEPDVYYVKTSVAAYKRLAKNTLTPTTPAKGEFGVSGGLLYINVDSLSDPATQSINYAWGRCYNIVVEDSEAAYNIADPKAQFLEGHGFALDAYTDDSIFRRLYSHHNQGAAFSLNLGDRNTLESSIAEGNGVSAVSAASCENVLIKHNTLINNNQSRAPYNGEIVFLSNAKNGVISNNSMEGSTVRAVDLDATCTGFSGNKNNVYGYSTIESGSTLTNTTTVYPNRDSRYRPQAATLKNAAAYLGGLDFYGKEMSATPNIGAVDVQQAARTLATRTQEARTATTRQARQRFAVAA